MSTVEALKKIEKAENSGNLQDLVDAVDACKSALSEIDNSEPVAWATKREDVINELGTIAITNAHKNNLQDYEQVLGALFDIPLFTFPPKREWKELSRDEKTRLSLKYSGHLFYELCNAIEAKLKELNHD